MPESNENENRNFRSVIFFCSLLSFELAFLGFLCIAVEVDAKTKPKKKAKGKRKMKETQALALEIVRQFVERGMNVCEQL